MLCNLDIIISNILTIFNISLIDFNNLGPKLRRTVSIWHCLDWRRILLYDFNFIFVPLISTLVLIPLITLLVISLVIFLITLLVISLVNFTFFRVVWGSLLLSATPYCFFDINLAVIKLVIIISLQILNFLHQLLIGSEQLVLFLFDFIKQLL